MFYYILQSSPDQNCVINLKIVKKELEGFDRGTNPEGIQY